MNDLISRQDAINEANAWLLDCFKVQKQDRSCGLIRRLEDLPSAQQWIPCSERLPEEDGRYLCTYSDFGTCVDFGLYADGQWIIEPIAWMPLPQPFRMDGKI